MAELTLTDLVANRTMSAGMAALLAAAAEERRSLLMVAIPRMAGKSTVMDAVLEHRTKDSPIYSLGTRHGDTLGIPETSEPTGYLAWSEIANHPVTDSYLWGAPVRRIFEAAHIGGHAIATALHADGIESAFAVIAENDVTDEQASQIDVVAYIRSIGHWETPTRRAIESLYEVDRVEAARPVARLLHRWDEPTDTFEVVAAPSQISLETYEARLAQFTD
ncbi:MAG: hypothetical protein HOH95_06195 [Dehalococcoidia bacterium]|jgi:hypothetical protein|nr:hypothetical protein [Dehalococcoidia bacterium]